jgi:hypothetical protein
VEHEFSSERLVFMCSTWNNGREIAPSWRVQTEKSQLSAFKRGGVPVFNLPISRPS